VGVGAYIQENIGFAVVFAKPKSERASAFSSRKKLSIHEVSGEISAILSQIPGIIPMVKPMPVLDISTSASDSSRGKYSYTLSGLNAQKVYATLALFKQKLGQIPGVIPYTINSDVELSNPELNIDYQRDKLSMTDLPPMNLEYTLGQFYSLNYLYLIKGEYEQYKVILAPEKQYRYGMQDLKWLFARNTAGRIVNFENVARTRMRLGPTVVCHKSNFPSATISFGTAPGIPIGRVAQSIETMAKEVVPSDVMGEFGGEIKDFRETVINMTWLLLLAVFIIYVVLGILYEHYVYPIVVLTTLPVAVVGGLLTLWIFRAEFSLYAFIGLFMLMGVVKKNGIILVDFALEKQKQGMDPREAVHRACLERLRPIIMTSLCTVFGLLPIALGFGADGASRIPLGLSVVGGMMFAQLLTLFVTPVIYLGMNRFASNPT
jgi:HAE1 family hydrophobic/amphiphilic exporter-1